MREIRTTYYEHPITKNSYKVEYYGDDLEVLKITLHEYSTDFADDVYVHLQESEALKKEEEGIEQLEDERQSFYE